MRSKTCTNCGLVSPVNSMFRVNEQNYCEPCADNLVARLQGLGEPLSVSHCVDPTICSMCSADAGSTELPLAGTAPVCNACHDKVYKCDYPQWLKLSLVATLLVLVIALVHGRHYFTLGRALFRAEHLISDKHYAAAVPLLRTVVDGAPECEKCVLLLAKADLLSGDPEDAGARVKKHHDGRFETRDELTAEVTDLFNRTDRAISLVNEAAELANKEQNEEALKKIRDAQQVYPEWSLPREAEKQILVAMQFDRKDYDGFLASSELAARENPNDPTAVALLSSALACKYATTGDGEFRTKAEQTLARAAQLATTEEQRRDLQEYSERIQHRLRTREIITRDEYNRRFRTSGKEGSK